jgi:hypothetical protein
MQPCERQFHLGLNAGRASYPAADCVTGQVLEQCRLAYAWLAVCHQYPALTGTNGLRELV